MVEKQGKTIGKKLKGSLDKFDPNQPGPGQYSAEKLKKADLQYSMGAKLGDIGTLNVPGPGTYDPKAEIVCQEKGGKFGNGQRSNLGLNLKNKSPGPGEHDGDFTRVYNKAPVFGFGSETR